jgi:hypothetical protein
MPEDRPDLVPSAEQSLCCDRMSSRAEAVPERIGHAATVVDAGARDRAGRTRRARGEQPGSLGAVNLVRADELLHRS